jgi:hypothetical protein
MQGAGIQTSGLSNFHETYIKDFSIIAAQRHGDRRRHGLRLQDINLQDHSIVSGGFRLSSTPGGIIGPSVAIKGETFALAANAGMSRSKRGIE